LGPFQIQNPIRVIRAIRGQPAAFRIIPYRSSPTAGSDGSTAGIFISLVRFATGQHSELAPFPEIARQRFQDWLTRHETAAGKPFTTEQRSFLAHIADEIGANAALETGDLDHGTPKSRVACPARWPCSAGDDCPRCSKNSTPLWPREMQSRP
jgi:hypothetical protein